MQDVIERGNRMGNNELSICIVGKGNAEHLPESIGYASKISRKVIYVDLESDIQAESKARELGARVVDSDSMLLALQTGWVLFIKSNEMPVLSSAKRLRKMLRGGQIEGCGVYTKSTRAGNLLKNYQWVQKLKQYKKMGDSDYVYRIEPRLARKDYAKICLESLKHDNTEKISWVCGKIAPGIMIESASNQQHDDEESFKDHDLRSLKGELIHDVTPGEQDMVELSEAYTGFRIMHKGQLEGFMDGARRGFGNLKMYIAMLDFLCKEGYFKEARELFETWIEHRPGDKQDYNTQLMGGMIYSNLLELDLAIEWFNKICEAGESSLALANLGKLYLIMGKKEIAIDYLKRSKDVKDDVFLKRRILSTIDNDDWRPLKLTLCMIARDEEALVGKALKSIRGIADEVVVVDTGSSDRTKELIQGFGGKVIEAGWEDDFSKAKNLALDGATGDYILFMDADEYIDPRQRFGLALFKKLLPFNKDIAFGVKVEPSKESKDLSMSLLDHLLKEEDGSYQIRLFPNRRGIQYRGAVFEGLYEVLNELNIEIARNDLFKITHGMDDRQRRDRRKIPAVSRSLEFIHDRHKALEAGTLFLRLGELDRAHPWLAGVPEMEAGLSSRIGLLYLSQAKIGMAKEILVKAAKRHPESSEVALHLANVFYQESNYSEVINLLGKRLRIIDKELESAAAAAALYYCGLSFIETGNLPEGIEQLALAHEKDPAKMRYKIAGMYAFAKVEQWEEALQVAGQIASEEAVELSGEINNFADVARIFIDLNRHFAQAGKMEEAGLCHKIVEDIIKSKVSGEEDIKSMSEVIEGLEAVNDNGFAF